MYWEKKNGDLASGDDISVLAVSLKDVFSMINSNNPQENSNDLTEVPT